LARSLPVYAEITSAIKQAGVSLIAVSNAKRRIPPSALTGDSQ
jgi:hypothetical protein